jgi:hypothetical protein
MIKLGEKREIERLQRAADGTVPFEPNAFFERLIAMRKTNPRAFDSMSTPARSSLAYYEAAKIKAAMMKDE